MGLIYAWRLYYKIIYNILLWMIDDLTISIDNEAIVCEFLDTIEQ